MKIEIKDNKFYYDNSEVVKVITYKLTSNGKWYTKCYLLENYKKDKALLNWVKWLENDSSQIDFGEYENKLVLNYYRG